MSENITGPPEPVSTTPVQPSANDPTTAAGAAQAHSGRKDFSLGTTLGSLSELKEKAPDVYNQMMMGIAYTVVKSMRQHEERLKEMWREGREENR